MYAFIWLHLITPACFWKLEFPSNCSGSGENAARSLQAFLLQKLLRVFTATFKSPADSQPQLLSCSAGQWIKELRVMAPGGKGWILRSPAGALCLSGGCSSVISHASRAAMRISIRLIHIPWQHFAACPPPSP